MSEKKAITIKDLTVYYGQTPALNSICLNVEEKEYLGIIGPNGGGKSTFLKAILGLIPTIQGEISIFGKSFKENRGTIGYVPQFTLFDRKFPITVLEAVLMGRMKKGLSPFFRYKSEDKKIARELLNKVGLSSLENRQISALSGGEFQKMLIARALAINPKLLFLDEPTASVDAKSRDQIFGLLEELNKDMAIVLVTHDLMAISSQVKTLACLNKTMIYHGEPELNESIVNTLYGCPVDLIAHGVPHRVLKDHNHEGACNHV